MLNKEVKQYNITMVLFIKKRLKRQQSKTFLNFYLVRQKYEDEDNDNIQKPVNLHKNSLCGENIHEDITEEYKS